MRSPFGGGPEGSPGPPPTVEEAAVDTMDLYAEESARERIRTAGMPRVWNREGFHGAEDKYIDAQSELHEQEVREALEDRNRLKDVALEAATNLYNRQKELVARETELIEEKAANPSRIRHFMNKAQHNRRWRMGINVGLSAVALGLGAATGGTGVLVGMGLKAGWRAASGFFAGQAAYERYSGKKNDKQVDSELDAFNNLQPGQMSVEDREAMQQKLTSHETTQNLDENKVETAQQKILNESVADLAKRIEAAMKERGVRTINQRVDAAMAIINQELSDHLDMRADQINADRKSVLAKRAVGVLGAASFVGLGAALHSFLPHFGGPGGAGEAGGTRGVGGEVGHPGEPGSPGGTAEVGGGSPEGGGTNGGPVVHENLGKGIETSGHEHPYVYNIHDPNESYEAGNVDWGKNGVAVYEVKSGESLNQLSEHVLSRFKDWDQFSDHERQLKVNHLVKMWELQDPHPGDRLHTTYEMVSGSYHFEPGSVPDAAHATGFSPDHYSGPTPEVNNGLPDVRGFFSGDMHNVGTYADRGPGFINEISGGEFAFSFNSDGFAEVTVPKNMSATEFAERALRAGDPNRWSQFSTGERTLKIRHFANQLGRSQFSVGSKARFAREMLIGSLNYKR